MATRGKGDARLEQAMDSSLRAYASGNKKFFDYIRDDARIYVLDSAEPIIGRKEFEAAFGPSFVKRKRKVEVVNRDLQSSGNQAILSQTLQITTDNIDSFVRQTVIWERSADGADWQMSHIHNALVGQPIVSGVALRSARDIRVLNERIATVAAAVGVAQ